MPPLTQDEINKTGMTTKDMSIRAATPTEPTVTASQLEQPVTPVTVPEPQVGTFDVPKTVGAVATDVQNFITAQSEDAKQLKELQRDFAALGDNGSLSKLFQNTLDQGGVGKNLEELKDINLQLTDRATASDLTKVGIAGAAGQTLGQGQRELTQEDREAAVRSAGLAARASVLQGNINTAMQLAKDTVDLAYKDRTLQSQNLIKQIEQVQGTVDDQTEQLLEQEKRKYEADLATVQELKTNISNAIVSGASQQEITQLNDPNLDDATKLALAQQIQSRAAAEQLEQQRLESAALVNQRNASAAASIASRDKTIAEKNEIGKLTSGGSNFAVQALDNFSGKLQENQREQFTKAVTAAVERGDADGVEIALRNAVQAAEGKELTKEVIGRDQAIKALIDINGLLGEYQSKGGETGLLQGGYEDLQQKLGRTSDPDLAEIETRIRASIQSYRKAISGAAFTESESQEYEGIFPQTSNNFELNTSNIGALIDTFELNNRVFYGNSLGGYTAAEIAEQAVYDELISKASPEQLAELEQ